MEFKEGSPLYSHQVEREGGEDILYVNYLGAPFVPNLAESADVMAKTVDSLIENPNVSRIVFVQQKNYNYDKQETNYLIELAQFYVYLIKQEKILSRQTLSAGNDEDFARRYNDLFSFLFLLKQDPVAAYHDLKKLLIEERIFIDKLPEKKKVDEVGYLHLLMKTFEMLDSMKMIRDLFQYFGDYKRGSREIYDRIFKADTIPNFTFTRLVLDLPDDSEIVDQYKIAQESFDESLVTILKKKNESKFIYHLTPPENMLEEDYTILLNLARTVLMEHQPKAEEFTDTERTRQVFFNISKDLLQDLAQTKNVELDYSGLNKLATILVRHTIGFGVVEILLQDKKLQDIFLNAPIPQTNIFLRHGEYGECTTNILPSQEDIDSWAAKFRMISGRPLDEANPILDTQLEIGTLRARIAIIQKPLSMDGLAYAIRRHREDPWTLPLFVKNKMLNPFSAGLLSFLIDGARTLLVAGTRSSGKCVDGDTLIQLSDGNIIKIKDLVGEKKKDIEDGIIYNSSKKDICVPSLLGMNLSSRQISDVWKRSSPAKVIKIKTKSGKEIITTKEHPYFVYDFGLKNLRADKLIQGNLIASPRHLSINQFNSEPFIELKDKSQVIRETDDFYILKGKTNSSIVKFPKKLSPSLAEFIGLIIGDGHIDSKKLEFHNNCEELRERYISFLKILGIPYRVFKSRTTMVVQVSSRTLCKTLSEVFEIPLGNKSDRVIIPSIILKSNNSVLSSFLRGYFDTDGYCPVGKRDLELATASKIMSEHLRLALLRFGIIAFTKSKEINGARYYRTLIRGDFASKFIKEIGFSHPFKKQRAELIASKLCLDNTNIDIIPQGNRLVKELRVSFRASPRDHRKSGKDYWAYENNQCRVSRKWFKKIVSFYNERYSKILSFKNHAESLRKLANFNLKDYISKIEQVKKLLDVSYTSIANSSGLSERGVRKILQNQQIGGFGTLNQISLGLPYLNEVAIQKNCEQAIALVGELSVNRLLLNSISAGISLIEFRNFFNISNEEFASAGVSLTTVSNFFNGKCAPNFAVVQLMAKKAVEVYDSCLNQETKELLVGAICLANSDIFWDEITSVEEINKVDNFVYDLTVEDTHNFVANGLIAHNTSLLGSLMLEILPKYRMVVIEDTPELPVESLRKLNYNIVRMKVRSAMVKTSNEISAEDGIRTSLRLGDSSLIIGEVRSEEAKALYEAMRVGALANVVAGTIHGASPYGVFDRVVNDLGVPATSFKATDIIAIANPIKTPDGLKFMRRLLQITEIRKHWKEDPLSEQGFVDLVKYNVEKDELEPTEDLINGDSEIIKDIASNVRGWAGNWDAVYDNILLRAKIKKEIADFSKKTGNEKILESEFNSLSNNAFHQISEKVMEEIGLPMGDRVFPEWQSWLNKEIKKKRL